MASGSQRTRLHARSAASSSINLPRYGGYLCGLRDSAVHQSDAGNPRRVDAFSLQVRSTESEASKTPQIQNGHTTGGLQP